MTGTVPTALRLLAKEIGVPSKRCEGYHALPDRQALLDVLTDQLLVVWQAAEIAPALTVAALHRLRFIVRDLL